MMKKIIITALCALSLFATSVVVLNGKSKPNTAFGGGFGFIIR